MRCCARTRNFLATDNCPPSEAADVLGGPQTVEAMKKTGRACVMPLVPTIACLLAADGAFLTGPPAQT